MKNSIEFNHNRDSLPEALGVEQHKYAAQLAAIMTIMMAEEEGTTSRISEMLHKCVDYNIILMLATNRFISMIEDIDNKLTFPSDN